MRGVTVRTARANCRGFEWGGWGRICNGTSHMRRADANDRNQVTAGEGWTYTHDSAGNRGRILGAVLKEWPVKLALSGKKVEAAGIYMPAPLPHSLVPIPVTRKNSKVPIFLLFGGGGSNASGREVGLGLRLGSKVEYWAQVWRMDFHDPHKDNTDADYWMSGAFHHHVMKAPQSPPPWKNSLASSLPSAKCKLRS